jgi:hypothetical protein
MGMPVLSFDEGEASEIASMIPPDDLVQIGKDLDMAEKFGAPSSGLRTGMPDRDLTPKACPEPVEGTAK